MNRRLARALVALAIPALAVPALTTPAVAAPKGPAVPTIDAVAKIYPHLEGGVVDVESSKVPSVEAGCKEGKPYPGSKMRFASYDAADGSFDWTAKKPLVSAGAMSFRKADQASEILEMFTSSAADCLGFDELAEEDGVKMTTKKIRFKAGDESGGATVTMSFMGQKSVMHLLAAREGKIVAITWVMSSKGTPPVKKAIRLERLALDIAS